MKHRIADRPATLLRLEGAAAVVLALLLYRELGVSWLWFAALFFLPDISLLGYVANARWGAVLYNTLHTYTLPAAVWGFGFILEASVAMVVGLVWTAHIGVDRLLGLGLKYPEKPRPTHLQRVE